MHIRTSTCSYIWTCRQAGLDTRVQACACTCDVYTRACMHVHTSMYVHVRAPPSSCTNVQVQVNACTHMYARTGTTAIQKCALPRARNALQRMYTHALIFKYLHARVRTPARRYMHAHTCTHAPARMCAHGRTHGRANATYSIRSLN